MIAASCLLLQSFLATPPPPERLAGAEPVVALLSAEEGAFRVAGFVRPGDSTPFPIPLSTRSERVTRAEFGHDGLVLGVFGQGGSALDAFRVQAIAHAPAAQVLVSQDGPVWVGPVELPRAVSVGASTDVLPLLARQDGAAIQDCIALVEPPASLGPADRLVLVPQIAHAGVEWFSFFVREELEGGGWGAGQTYRVRPTARHAVVVETNGRRVQVLLSADAEDDTPFQAQLDQAFYATVRRVDEFALDDVELVRVDLAPVGPTTLDQPGGFGPRTSVPTLTAPREGRRDVTDVVAWNDDVVVDLEHGAGLWARFAPPTEHFDTEETWTLLVHLDPRPITEEATMPKERVALGLEREPAAFPLGAEPEPRGWFVDAAADWGVACGHLEGPDEQLDIRPTMGPGAAFGDVDGDGRVDLYVVQGGSRAGSAPLANRMFLNRGTSFRDFTERSRAGDTGLGMGALFFDPDGDGDLDLYVANYGIDAFYNNGGQGIFLEQAAAVGIAGDRWSASAVAGDADEDGDLDLYVTSYLEYDVESLPSEADLARYQREDPVEMLPFAFPAAANVVYRNDSFRAGGVREGELVFVDATQGSGIADAAGRGMQAAFWDFDQDGDQDLYVANDVSYNVLFRNEGKGRFRDVSFSTGMDDPRGGMGVAIGDVDGDLDEDLFLTNWELEPNALYVNNLLSHKSRKHRVGTFRDQTVDAGFAPYGVGVTSWGAQLFDLENDGDLDLFVANGYTSPDYESTGICVGQPNHLFVNDGYGRFRAAFDEGGPALAVERSSRCALACDFDKDGAVELLVTANNGLLQLLDNASTDLGHWIGVRLRQNGPNQFAIGATVRVEAGGRTWFQTLRAGSGYLGGNAPELHFGLGEAESIDLVEVRWPDGLVTEHEGKLDRWFTVVRP